MQLRGDYPALPGERSEIWAWKSRGEPFELRASPERLRFVWEGTWVEYARLRQLKERLLAFLGCTAPTHRASRAGVTPDCPSRQCAIVSSVAAHGTTSLIRSLRHDAQEHFRRRIVFVSMPPDCSFRRLVDLIINEIDPMAMRGRTTWDDRYLRMTDELRRASPLAIAIDDGGHMLNLDPRRRERLVEDLISLSFRERVRLILATPPVIAAEIMRKHRPFDVRPLFVTQRSDVELHPFRRFDLPRFRVDEEYLAILDLWERTLPLNRASQLVQRNTALRLYELCDGVHGALAAVLRKAAETAIDSGIERVTLDLLHGPEFEPSTRFTGFRF